MVAWRDAGERPSQRRVSVLRESISLNTLGELVLLLVARGLGVSLT